MNHTGIRTTTKINYRVLTHSTANNVGSSRFVGLMCGRRNPMGVDQRLESFQIIALQLTYRDS